MMDCRFWEKGTVRLSEVPCGKLFYTDAVGEDGDSARVVYYKAVDFAECCLVTEIDERNNPIWYKPPLIVGKSELVHLSK